MLLVCANLSADEIYCHAAASLTDALTEIGKLYMQETDERVFFNFGASSLLVRQIEEGAPGDLMFSADEEKMDSLEQKGLLLPSTRKSVLSNTLVIVVSLDSTLKLKSAKELENFKGRIAIAEYLSVPAGIYARQYLMKIGIWEKIQDRLVPVQNVRAALAAVESGNVETGFVYKTDAQISKRVRIAYEIPQKEGPVISYSLAVLKESKDPATAKRFWEYILKPESLKIFQKYGFLTVTSSGLTSAHFSSGLLKKADFQSAKTCKLNENWRARMPALPLAQQSRVRYFNQ